MKDWVRQLKQNPQIVVGVVIVIVLVAFGLGYLLGGHAAGPYTTGNIASGDLTGSATVRANTTANGGSSVQFGLSTVDCVPTSLPGLTVDTAMTNAIADQFGPGWIGADSSYSTKLPDGQVAFAFSDTILGTTNSSGVASLTGFIHSSELVGTPPNFKQVLGGTASAPATLITDTNTGVVEWEVAGTYVENNQQLIFVNEFNTAAGGLGDTYSGNSGIAVMDLPANGLPTYTSVMPIPSDSATQWGNGVMTDSKYHYIYGESGSGMKLARIPIGDTLTVSDWQYWDNTTSSWSSKEADATVMSTTYPLTGVSLASGGGYMALSTGNSVYNDNHVYISYSCTPEGPWSVPVAIYTIPEIAEYPNEIAYMSQFHPELNDTNGMVVSYNVDTLNSLADLATNIHQYQPRFLYLK
jgi:hypothetical protein